MKRFDRIQFKWLALSPDEPELIAKIISSLTSLTSEGNLSFLFMFLSRLYVNDETWATQAPHLRAILEAVLANIKWSQVIAQAQKEEQGLNEAARDWGQVLFMLKQSGISWSSLHDEAKVSLCYGTELLAPYADRTDLNFYFFG